MPEINPNPTHTKINYKFRNKSELYFLRKNLSSFQHICKDFLTEYTFSEYVLRAINEMVLEHLETHK